MTDPRLPRITDDEIAAVRARAVDGTTHMLDALRLVEA